MITNSNQSNKQRQLTKAAYGKKVSKSLVFWVFIGLFAGIIFGTIGSFHNPHSPSVFVDFFYSLSINAKAYTIDPFIKGLKLLMGPIIFLTIITGIVRLEDLKTLGSLGIKTVIYFEIVSTFALIIGVLFGEVIKPGHGMHLNTESLDASSIQQYIQTDK